MTLTDMLTYSSDLLDDPNNGYFSTTILTQRLNLAQKELQKRLISANQDYYDICVTTQTVASQAAYALPTDFIQIIRLDYITQGSGATAINQKIQAITPNQVDLLANTNGDPQCYYLQRNNIILAPVPNRVVTLHLTYSYLVSDMVSGSDVPDAPAQFHEYIPIITVRDCLIKDGRALAPIESKLAQYELLLKQIAVQREADGPRMVTQTQSLDWGY